MTIPIPSFMNDVGQWLVSELLTASTAKLLLGYQQLFQPGTRTATVYGRVGSLLYKRKH